MSASEKAGWRIVFAGTGGQGVVTAARILTDFFSARGNQVVSGQLHGMAQRGGSVQASVMIDSGISPVIPAGGADCVVGFEPVETVRALPYMSERTTVFMNTTPVVPYVLSQQVVRGKEDAKYPAQESLTERVLAVTPKLMTFDATELARSSGMVKTLNVVMIGCLFGSGILPATADEFFDTVMKAVPPKLAEANERAFKTGVEFGSKLGASEESF